jgi:hypothetical protein
MSIFSKATLGSIKSAWANAPRAAKWAIGGAAAGAASSAITGNSTITSAGLGAAGATAWTGRKELASTLRMEGAKLGEAWRGAKFGYNNPMGYGRKQTPW